MSKVIEDYIKQNHFGRLMNMEFEIIAPGVIVYKMQPTEKMEALDGMTHGGAIAGFVDGILGLAALSEVEQEGKYVATIEFKINYLKPIKTNSKLIGEGKVISRGQSTLVSEGKIYSDGELLVSALGTFKAYSKSN